MAENLGLIQNEIDETSKALEKVRDQINELSSNSGMSPKKIEDLVKASGKAYKGVVKSVEAGKKSTVNIEDPTRGAAEIQSNVARQRQEALRTAIAREESLEKRRDTLIDRLRKEAREQRENERIKQEQEALQLIRMEAADVKRSAQSYQDLVAEVRSGFNVEETRIEIKGGEEYVLPEQHFDFPKGVVEEVAKVREEAMRNYLRPTLESNDLSNLAKTRRNLEGLRAKISSESYDALSDEISKKAEVLIRRGVDQILTDPNPTNDKYEAARNVIDDNKALLSGNQDVEIRKSIKDQMSIDAQSVLQKVLPEIERMKLAGANREDRRNSLKAFIKSEIGKVSGDKDSRIITEVLADNDLQASMREVLDEADVVAIIEGAESKAKEKKMDGNRGKALLEYLEGYLPPGMEQYLSAMPDVVKRFSEEAGKKLESAYSSGLRAKIFGKNALKFLLRIFTFNGIKLRYDNFFDISQERTSRVKQANQMMEEANKLMESSVVVDALRQKIGTETKARGEIVQRFEPRMQRIIKLIPASKY